MPNNALIIFVQNLKAGKAQTMLAKAIGESEALAVYRQLMLHTFNITQNIAADKYIFYSDFINEDDLWSSGNCFKELQQGNSDSERALLAFEHLFTMGYKKVVMVGSNSIEIDAVHIKQAFYLLNDYDVVIGPEHDAAFYLFSMKQLHEELFIYKANAHTQLYYTMSEMEKMRITYHLLPVLNDVDEEKHHYLLRHRQ